ncbi:hypothetical protein BGZ97_001309 [Linnemannia gamsii]|uniref:DUF1640-domain-containing protein n=1 Tax=Linnemannia gamsii TaxID=64522 RepID=A0A9P6UJD9_9FUNG|nr:hypothetical protein BGZ97_001309 [Linnemannia gamsii]
MSKLIFDTYEFIKRLTAAGMPLEQAEILSDQQARLIDERLATKNDLARLEVQIDEKFASLNKDMDARFESMNKDIDARFGSMNKDIDARFESMKKDTDTHFALASKDTDVKLSKLRDTLVAWVIGSFLAQTSLIVGLFKLLPTSSIG